MLAISFHDNKSKFCLSFTDTDETYLDDDEIMEEEILRQVQQQQQSRFHEFERAPAPVPPVPTIVETSNVRHSPEQKPADVRVDSPVEEPEEQHQQQPQRPLLDLLDPMDRDPAILSDNSDIAYETLEVEFIDDDADWEDEEFDDEPDEIYSGEESPDPDDIESPVSHDEEEEVVSDVDDTDLMARLEAKYGKLNI